MTQLIVSAWLLIFSVEQRNPAKATKSCQIPRDLLEMLTNTCRYSIFETYLGYWGCSIAVNLQIYLETLSPQRANNVPKLPRVYYVGKNWALVMTLKALPLAHFSSTLLLKQQMIIAVKKHKTRSSNQRKIDRFLVRFGQKLSKKLAVFY